MDETERDIIGLNGSFQGSLIWGSVETEFNFIFCVNLILSPPPTFAISFLVLCVGLLKLYALGFIVV